MSFTFPPNSPRRFDVKMPFKPRSMNPVFYQKVGQLMVLMPLAMESVRKHHLVKCTETPVARRNLQVWVNTLGPALFNPVLWHYFPDAKAEMLSFTIRGQHRTRILKALDFDFIYIYLCVGSYRGLPKHITKAMASNTCEPTVSTYPKNCGGCGKTVYDYFKVDDLTRFYRCGNCGFEGSNQIFYPLPM